MPRAVTRREALARLAVAGASLPLLAAGNAVGIADIMPRSDLGVSPIKYTLGIASYSLRGLPLTQALQAVRRVGLEFVSVNRAHLPWENPPAGWEATLAKFKEAGVTPRCCGVITLKNDEAAVRGACEYARKLGVPMIACSPEPEALPLLERYLNQYDLRAAIHNHGPEDRLWAAPRDVWEAVKDRDPRLGMCLDVGHAFRSGADPADCIRRYRDRLLDVHLKDSTAAVGAEDVPVEIGRGYLDQRAIVRALREVGYGRMVWFEYEKSPDDPLPGLAESVGFIRGLTQGLLSG